MFKLFKSSLMAVATVLLIFSCQVSDVEEVQDVEEVSLVTQGKIQSLGFDVNDIVAFEDGYIVEGDIFLTDEDINEGLINEAVPVLEQYRTSNRVNVNGSRTIRLWLAPDMRTAAGGKYLRALRTARNRYNNTSGLTINFQITNNRSIADISITSRFVQPDAQGRVILGSAGFPRNGNPHNEYWMNRWYYDSRGTTNDIATTMAHEIGHCIGLRHTDYFNRAISCGGPFDNEGSGSIGAIRIPGTPSGADLAGAGSYMLACSGGNRPFTANDITALRWLF